MTEADVTVLNLPTDKLPLALKAKKADAIVAWQPSSGNALNSSPGSKAVLPVPMSLALYMMFFLFPMKVWKPMPVSGKKLSGCGSALQISLKIPKTEGKSLKS